MSMIFMLSYRIGGALQTGYLGISINNIDCDFYSGAGTPLGVVHQGAFSLSAFENLLNKVGYN